MSQEKRIRDLEDAVLHLSRAMNRLIEAHKLGFSEAGFGEPPRFSLGSEHSIKEAREALQKAVDLMSVKEYE